MPFAPDDIINALRHVDDPDIKKDLVTLNMISNVVVTETKASFKLTLTTPACPLKEKIKKDCIDAIHQYVDEKLVIEIDIDSNVASSGTM